MALLLKATERGAQLEWPQEVVGLLEVVSNSPDLVDEVLDARDALLAERSSNDGVVIESETRLVDLAVTALVDKLADGVTSGVAVSHVWLDNTDHVDGGSVKLDKDTVVELTETEKLHDLLGLGWELVNTDKLKKHAQLINEPKTDKRLILTREF